MALARMKPYGYQCRIITVSLTPMGEKLSFRKLSRPQLVKITCRFLPAGIAHSQSTCVGAADNKELGFGTITSEKDEQTEVSLCYPHPDFNFHCQGLREPWLDEFPGVSRTIPKLVSIVTTQGHPSYRRSFRGSIASIQPGLSL